MNVITQEVAATYDRLNISYRKAAASFTVTAKVLGHNLDDVSVSASTMYRTRHQHRKSIAESYQSEEFCPGSPLVLHLDGKLINLLTGLPYLYHLAVKRSYLVSQK